MDGYHPTLAVPRPSGVEWTAYQKMTRDVAGLALLRAGVELDQLPSALPQAIGLAVPSSEAMASLRACLETSRCPSSTMVTITESTERPRRRWPSTNGAVMQRHGVTSTSTDGTCISRLEPGRSSSTTTEESSPRRCACASAISKSEKPSILVNRPSIIQAPMVQSWRL